MSIKQCIILNSSPIKNQFCDLYFRPTTIFKFEILSSNVQKDEGEEATTTAIFGFAIFFSSRRQIFALSSNCCRNFKWLLRGEVVYTIAIANATEVRIGLVRTYHLHFSRQLFVQRIEYIALLLRRSPANSVVGRYDIIAMNYSKP